MPSLEGIGSINFVLGLREFDPSQHQPHPPGYPVLIALGRGALAPALLLAAVVFRTLIPDKSLGPRPAARAARSATCCSPFRRSSG